MDDLKEILEENEIDILMEILGGEIIRVPDFAWMCKRLGINDKERMAVIANMVETYVRKDNEARAKAQKKKDPQDSFSLFR